MEKTDSRQTETETDNNNSGETLDAVMTHIDPKRFISQMSFLGR